MALPTLGSLSPVSALAGSGDFPLTVSGTNFDNSAVVYWGSAKLTTTFVSSTQLTAAVPADFVKFPGAAIVSVTTTAGSSGTTPAPGLSFLITSVFDLTTVSAIKGWLSALGTPSSSVTDDANIQACISAAGAHWLQRTGRANADCSLPAASPLLEPLAFSEWYDGNGGPRLFLRQQPIVSVQSLQINGVSIPASTGFGSAGFVVHQDGKSLILRVGASGSVLYTGSYFGRGSWFSKGLQNVQVAYTAGFRATPPDITLACLQMVAVNYRRRSWIDQKSQAMAEGAGTVTYRDWELPPEVLRVMRAYTRTALA